MARGYRRALIVRHRAGRHTPVATGKRGLQGMREQLTLEAIFGAMTEGVVIYDLDGHIAWANQAMNRLLGVGAARTYAFPLSAERGAGIKMPATGDVNVLAGGVPQASTLPGQLPDTVSRDRDGADICVHEPDGHDSWFRVTGGPLRDASGAIFGTVAIYRDVTGYQQLKREYAEAQANVSVLHETVRHMEDFLATAAHELRSPLAVALGKLQLAQRRFARQRNQISPFYPEFAGVFAAIHKGMGEATRSVKQLAQSAAVLLDVSRASTGRLDLHLERHDLVTLVRTQVQSHCIATPHRQIRLDRLGEQPALVDADGMRIGQVVTNYLTNALKYSAADGPVEVEVRIQDGAVRVAVRDNGPGLPQIEQARVWEMFYRTPGVEALSDDGGGAGLGLGLHICKRIIEQHGGTVGVESTIGAGSTFWFTLPLARVEASPTYVSVGGGKHEEGEREVNRSAEA